MSPRQPTLSLLPEGLVVLLSLAIGALAGSRFAAPTVEAWAADFEELAVLQRIAGPRGLLLYLVREYPQARVPFLFVAIAMLTTMLAYGVLEPINQRLGFLAAIARIMR